MDDPLIRIVRARDGTKLGRQRTHPRSRDVDVEHGLVDPTVVDRLRGRPVKAFRYRNKGELATIGRSRAVAMLPRDIELSGFWAWALYMSVHLFYLSGFRTRVLVFLSWVWSYLTWARGARLIPSVKRPFTAQAPAAREEAPSAPLH